MTKFDSWEEFMRCWNNGICEALQRKCRDEERALRRDQESRTERRVCEQNERIRIQARGFIDDEAIEDDEVDYDDDDDGLPEITSADFDGDYGQSQVGDANLYEVEDEE
jgi:hypothetical protein